ncbi:hypothetical protein [Campylobacter ureolyticus]|uniref:hypothetical protein n=1 Tax=Campylobacter ureolyticus TaxID=827 RepID=UPI0022B38DB9|nr:hypothetical protein [Campylobacter ureolyticus]MCZ6168529.1 hypothetical protein [Campylobacter ureolyticus]
MSDDKREKLREYLRNNRHKNKINLDNNSNLDNSQISNNKINSNKRDYDKEPLIIYEYSSAINLFFGIIVLVVSVFFVFIWHIAKIINSDFFYGFSCMA